MTYIHFTGPASHPQLKLKGPRTMTDTDAQPDAQVELHLEPAPSYLPLFSCLKRMIPLINYPRLRFVLPRGPNEPNALLDFYYFQEDDTVHLHYRERHHGSIYLGPINPDGTFTNKPFPEQSITHIGVLLRDLKTDFRAAIESYGTRTHTCALCGQPLIDPSSLARGTTPNCTVHLQPPASLNDI